MPNTINFEFGDVVLVPFPFIDHSTSKQRPAIVVSSDVYNQRRTDLILIAVTSQVYVAPTDLDVAVRHWQQAGLVKPSAIKPLLTTIEKHLVIKKLGRLAYDDQRELQQTLARLLSV